MNQFMPVDRYETFAMYNMLAQSLGYSQLKEVARVWLLAAAAIETSSKTYTWPKRKQLVVVVEHG